MSKNFLMGILALVLVFGAACVEAWIGMLLFNWVMRLFGCAFALTFWQAFGIHALLSFVGGFFKSNSKSK